MKIHPSKDIVSTRGDELAGKTLVLCITGSVAAVQCSEIARELMRHGAEVFVVMSHMAQKIVHPYLMEWATGNPVVTELTGKLEHVALVGEYPDKADAVLIAPATANSISKIACGIDDTPVTSLVSVAFGLGIPILIVPAMHESMYRHSILTDNIKKLQVLDVEVIGPRMEEGKAKIAATEEIVTAIVRKLGAKDMVGMRVLVTAGATIEYIDPVRVITNKSSGKMGIAVAEEARRRGAEVTLVYGRAILPSPIGVRVIHAETTKEMSDAVLSELKSTHYNVFVATAAAADFEPEKMFERKMDTHTTPKLELKLKATPKIIDEARKTSSNTFLVAFKAEYKLSDNDLVDSAYKRLKTSHADLIVANDVGREGVGFQTDTNEVFVINKDKTIIHIPLTTKQEIAKKLVDVIVEEISGKS